MRHDSHLLPGPVAFKKPLSLFLAAALLMGPVSPGFAREDRFPGARNEFNDPHRGLFDRNLNKGPAAPEDRQMQIKQAQLAFMRNFSARSAQPLGSAPRPSLFAPAKNLFSGLAGGLFFSKPPEQKLAGSAPLSFNRAGSDKTFSTTLAGPAPRRSAGLAGGAAAPGSAAKVQSPVLKGAASALDAPSGLKAAGLPGEKLSRAGLPAAPQLPKSGLAQRMSQAAAGQKTLAEIRLPDGRLLQGAVQVDRSGNVAAIQPGTFMTVDQTPARINGTLWKQGTFLTPDGKTFHLAGTGVEVADQLPGYRLLGENLEIHRRGDGAGNTEILAVGPLEQGNRLRDQTTGLAMTYQPGPDARPGAWELDANQTARLPVGEALLPIGLDQEGRLARPPELTLFSAGREQKIKVAGILPNPETGGYQLLAQTQASADAPLRLDGLTGAEPGNKFLPENLLAARQETAAARHAPSLQTHARVRQENGEYILSGGPVALNITTNPDGSAAYLGAVLAPGSRLTVTGPTYFPGPDVTVIAGTVLAGGDGAYRLQPGALYQNASGVHLLAPDARGTLKPLPVQNLNLQEGTFNVVLKNHIVEGNRGVERLELPGKIDSEAGTAALVKTAVTAHIVPLEGIFQKEDIRDLGQFRVAMQQAIPGNESLWEAMGVSRLAQAREITQDQALDGLNKALSLPDLHAHFKLETKELDSKTKSLLKDARRGKDLTPAQLRTLNRALLGKVYARALAEKPRARPGPTEPAAQILYVAADGAVKPGPKIHKSSPFQNWLAGKPNKTESPNKQDKASAQERANEKHEFPGAVLNPKALAAGIAHVTNDRLGYLKGAQVWGEHKIDGKKSDNILYVKDGETHYKVHRLMDKGLMTVVKAEEIKKADYEEAVKDNPLRTWCNFAVRQVADKFGVAKGFAAPAETANAMCEKLAAGRYNADGHRFRAVTWQEAEKYASQGGFAVAGWRNTNAKRSGHVVVLAGGFSGEPSLGRARIFQADDIHPVTEDHNFGHLQLSKAFKSETFKAIKFYIWEKDR